MKRPNIFTFLIGLVSGLLMGVAGTWVWQNMAAQKDTVATPSGSMNFDLPTLIGAVQSGNEIQAERLVKQALSDGLHPDSELGPNGETLLIYAARSGQMSVVKVLLEGGATPDKTDRTGLSPMRAASVNSHPSIVREIMLRQQKLNQ